MNSKILILGNATDRLLKKNEIKNWQYDLAICNLAFKEFESLPNINIVGTVHDWVAIEALKFKKEHNLSYRVLSNHLVSNEIEPFIKYRGFSTGLELVCQAINEKYDEIYLSGFCFINNDETDIYTPNLYCGNFRNQHKQIKKEFPNQTIKFL